MTNPAKPSALFAGTVEPDQGRCNGSLGGSRQAERCSGVFRRLRKPRKPWSGWSANRWDTERNLSGSIGVDQGVAGKLHGVQGTLSFKMVITLLLIQNSK
jgi:hypothetical protein